LQCVKFFGLQAKIAMDKAMDQCVPTFTAGYSVMYDGSMTI